MEFAAEEGLPVTFWDNDEVRYPSKGTRQTPTSSRVLRTKSWDDKGEYLDAVRARIGAKSLVEHNTVVNPRGPEPCDLADVLFERPRDAESRLGVPDVSTWGSGQLDGLGRYRRPVTLGVQAEYFRDRCEFVEMLMAGSWYIASKYAEVGYNTQKENRNWFFAIGGYSSWGVGRAVVAGGGPGSALELDFEYRFYDGYNSDKGKCVTFAHITVTDKFMGEFHRQGLAQEFDCFGSFKRHFSWKKGQPLPRTQMHPGGR